MDFKIKVDDEHFEYLRLQKGRLDQFSNNRSEWHRRYEADLERTFGEIAPFLPSLCWRILDVGSGLGGINILLSRYYAQTTQQSPAIHLLDGEDDPPEMTLHRETFNSMKAARSFLITNGISAADIDCHTPETKEFWQPYELIVSFGSWCFHYPPEEYLPRLLEGKAMLTSTRLILDMRTDKPKWQRALWKSGFRLSAVVREEPKYHRQVWERT